MNPEDRIQELEQEMLRMVDIVIELEDRVFLQEKYVRKLVELLKQHPSSD